VGVVVMMPYVWLLATGLNRRANKIVATTEGW
jgi:hypothetical protein